MLGGCAAFFDIKMRTKIDVAGRQDLEKTVDSAVCPRGDTVNLNAIARGEKNDFGEIAGQFESAAKTAELGGVNGEFFAQFYRGGFVAQTCNKKLHNLG